MDAARAWPGGSVELALPADAPPDLAALAGKSGVLALALVDYAGFEPVQRLVAGAVANGSPIDPAVANSVVSLQATDGVAPTVTIEPQWIDDALDEAVFVDQRAVEQQ